MIKIALVKNQILFLTNCRKFDIYPTHIYKNSIANIRFRSSFVNKKFRRYNDITCKRLLNWEIKDCHIHLKFLETGIYRLQTDIFACLPQHIVYNFFKNNFNKYVRRFDSLFFKSRNKFFTLLPTQKRNVRYSFNNSWVNNLTNIVIPDFVKRTLSYGD